MSHLRDGLKGWRTSVKPHGSRTRETKIRDSIEGASHSMIYVSPNVAPPWRTKLPLSFNGGSVFYFLFLFFLSKGKEAVRVSFVTRYHEFFESIDYTIRRRVIWTIQHTFFEDTNFSSANLLWSNIYKFYITLGYHNWTLGFHNLSHSLWTKKKNK